MKFNNSRRFKYGLNSSILLIGVIAIIIIINVFFSALVQKFPIKIDLTSAQKYELSDKTYEFLKTYNAPTTIYILSGEANQDLTIRAILDKYATTNKNVVIKNVNPSENPTFGKKYITDNSQIVSNSVIIDSGSRFKLYTPYELYNYTADQSTGQKYATSVKVEQKITAGLKYVSSDENFNVYFIQGHNEEKLDGARQILQNDNYTVQDLNISTDDIPKDAKMIVVAIPTVDYTMAEIAKLDKFFANAGKAQFIFDNSSIKLTNLYTYIKQWGIQVNDDIAVEQDKANRIVIGEGNMFLIKPKLETSEITDPIITAQRVLSYFPYSKSITTLFEANSGIEVKKILSTSENSYATTDFQNITQNDNSKKGTTTIAAVATKQGNSPENDSIIFVSGSPLLLDVDTTVISQTYGFANADFYSNVINYIQGSKDDYTISPKSLATDRLTLSGFDGLVLGIIFIIIVPLIILIFGVVVWFRRRNL